jgi:hypothetical protein
MSTRGRATPPDVGHARRWTVRREMPLGRRRRSAPGAARAQGAQAWPERVGGRRGKAMPCMRHAIRCRPIREVELHGETAGVGQRVGIGNGGETGEVREPHGHANGMLNVRKVFQIC